MDKIIAIATNDATELKGKRTGLWLSELTHFLHVIEAAGYGYDLASPQGGRIPLDERSAVAAQLADAVNAKYMADPAFEQRLEHSLSCSDVDPAQYVALYLSGGHGTMFDFRQSSALQRLITTMYSANKYLSGVCHGVAGLVDAKDASGRVIVTGKNVTGFSNFEDGLAGTKRLLPFLLEDALKQNGARYKKNLLPFTERVELDGQLITGQNPQSAAAVGRRLVEQLRS